MPSGFESDEAHVPTDIASCSGDHCPGGECREDSCQVNDVPRSECDDRCDQYNGITASDLDRLCEKDGYFAVEFPKDENPEDFNDYHDYIVDCIDGEAQLTECTSNISGSSYVDGVCRRDARDSAFYNCD